MENKPKKRKPLKRIYHHYEKWECFQAGMYVERKTVEREPFIQLAVGLLRDTTRLHKEMERASKEWFYSAQNHLTSRNSNRQAWFGQVACCIAHGVSESETREAWSRLSDKEREEANAVADVVILIWEGWHFDNEEKTRA